MHQRVNTPERPQMWMRRVATTAVHENSSAASRLPNLAAAVKEFSAPLATTG
ncbi:MAG: hypothetical protein RL745_112 [Actinomycetota bacterium]